MRHSEDIKNQVAKIASIVDLGNTTMFSNQPAQNLHQAGLNQLGSILLMIGAILFAWTSSMNTNAIAAPANLVSSPNWQSEQSAEILTADTNTLPPEVKSAVLNDAVKRTSKTISALRIREARSQTWSDGCLGLGNPDELCTQAITSGWQIVVTDGLRDWTYRTDDTGNAVRLEQLDGSSN